MSFSFPYFAVARELNADYGRVLQLADEIGSSQVKIDYWSSFPIKPKEALDAVARLLDFELRVRVAQAIVKENRRRREGPWV